MKRFQRLFLLLVLIITVVEWMFALKIQYCSTLHPAFSQFAVFLSVLIWGIWTFDSWRKIDKKEFERADVAILVFCAIITLCSFTGFFTPFFHKFALWAGVIPWSLIFAFVSYDYVKGNPKPTIE